jgi:predicted lipase
MGTALHELLKSLKNMIFMRKIKDVTVINSLEALGIVPVTSAGLSDDYEGQVITLWGYDPVHPTSAA